MLLAFSGIVQLLSIQGRAVTGLVWIRLTRTIKVSRYVEETDKMKLNIKHSCKGVQLNMTLICFF